MHRYLVVASRTLSGPQLLAKLRELAARGPVSFHVVVPAEHPKDHTWTEGEARDIAQRRLDAGLKRLAEVGLDADGEVGDEHPVEAIGDILLRGETFDGIVLSTLPPRASRWLRWDVVNKVQTRFDVPVIHVVGQPEPVPSG
jgi:hypothetical protein